jgi:hypothetical protein
MILFWGAGSILVAVYGCYVVYDILQTHGSYDIPLVVLKNYETTNDASDESEYEYEDESEPDKTVDDLKLYGVINSLEQICDQISLQIKKRCLTDLKNKYLSNRDYQRDPFSFFNNIISKRGSIRDLCVPNDLPIILLHKLHETPSYLTHLYHDDQNIHAQMIRELKKDPRFISS